MRALNIIRSVCNLVIFSIAGYVFADSLTKGNYILTVWLLVTISSRIEIYFILRENASLETENSILKKLLFHSFVGSILAKEKLEEENDQTGDEKKNEHK